MHLIKSFIAIVAAIILTSFSPVSNHIKEAAFPQDPPTESELEENFDNGEDGSSPEEVYWFYLRLKVNERKKSYSIIGTGSRVISGSSEEFEKALWWGTKVGQMAIGPFLKQREAAEARLLYRRTRKKIITKSEHKSELYWFLVTFKLKQRSKSYKLQRMPARLASGTQTEFLDALYEGMTFQHLTIGPFWDYVRAEDSKAMYRKNE